MRNGVSVSKKRWKITESSKRPGGFALCFLLPLAAAAIVLFALGIKDAIPMVIVGTIALYCVFVLRGGFQYAAIVLATAGIALAIAECVAVAITPHVVVTPPNLFVYDTASGLRPGKPGRYHARRTLIGTAGYDVVYTIDSQSMRRVEAGHIGKGITFFGDSFIFGWGLNDPDTLPQIFADLTGRRFPVFDTGVPGWSPANVLAEIQSGEADGALRHSSLAVQFVAPWHTERMTCGSGQTVQGPKYKVVAGGVERVSSCPAEEKSIFSGFSIYKTMIAPHLRRLKGEDVANLIAVTSESVKLVEEKYRVPMIIYYLRDPDYLHRLSLSWTDDQIMDALRKSGAQVLDYTLADGNNSRYRIEGDGHPTALANQIRAVRLLAFIRSKGYALLNIPPASNATAE
jgi:hypothetical protein